jgi:hypothetical protein
MGFSSVCVGLTLFGREDWPCLMQFNAYLIFRDGELGGLITAEICTETGKTSKYVDSIATSQYFRYDDTLLSITIIN